MKHTLITIYLIVWTCVCACAAPTFGEGMEPFAFKQSSQTNFSGSAYSSTVYQPFSNTTPATYSASAGSNGETLPEGITNIHKAFPNRPDYNQGQTSPVGESWVMLAFAAMAAGVIAYNRKRQKA